MTEEKRFLTRTRNDITYATKLSTYLKVFGKSILKVTMKKLLFVFAVGILAIGASISGAKPVSAQLTGQEPLQPVSAGIASPASADASVTITQSFQGPLASMICGEYGGMQAGFPGTPEQVSGGDVQGYQIDGAASSLATLASWTQTQGGTSGQCPSVLVQGALPTPAVPYLYQGVFSINTAGLSNGPHSFNVCFDQSLILGESSGGNCFGSSFTVQHAVAAPQIELSKMIDSVTYPATQTNTSVINFGTGPMNWNSNPDASYYSSLYNYSPTNGGISTGMLPKWLIANAQSSGSGPLAAGASQNVAFTYDHRYANIGNNNTQVNFYCINSAGGSCAGNPTVPYAVTYAVLPPTISCTVAANGQSGNSITVAPGTAVSLSWETTNADQDAGAMPVTISDVNGNLAANGSTQVTVSATTVFTANVNGPTVASGSNTATGTCTVNVSGVPGISVTPASLSFSTAQGSDPASQTITITNNGTASLSWTALGGTLIGGGATATFNVSPASGTLAAGASTQATVSVSGASSLAPGTYSSNIIVENSAQTSQSQWVPATLTITSPTNWAQLLINGSDSAALTATTPAWTVSLTSSEKSQYFTEYFSHNGSAFAAGASGNATDQSGSYSAGGPTGSVWAQNEAGTWQEYVKFADGTTSNTITYTISATATLSCSLNASPTQVSSGGTATLSWSSTGATSCTGSEGGSTGWNGQNLATSGGSWTTPALSVTTEFSASCSNAGLSTACLNDNGGTETTVSVSGPQPQVQAVTCSPSNQDTLVGQQVNFTATGGDGSSYVWLLPGGTASSPVTTMGSGSGTSDSYNALGQYWVTVTSGENQSNFGQCEVNVIAGNGNCSPNGSTTSCMSGGNGCGQVSWGTETCTSGEWGLCSATPPPNSNCPPPSGPSGYDCSNGYTCTSVSSNPQYSDLSSCNTACTAANACSQKIQARFCSSSPNSCGETTTGIQTCGTNGVWGSCNSNTTAGHFLSW